MAQGADYTNKKGNGFELVTCKCQCKYTLHLADFLTGLSRKSEIIPFFVDKPTEGITE